MRRDSSSDNWIFMLLWSWMNVFLDLLFSREVSEVPASSESSSRFKFFLVVKFHIGNGNVVSVFRFILHLTFWLYNIIKKTSSS